MQIFVRVPTGQTIAIEVEQTDAIEAVKTKIQTAKNIPRDMQVLKFGTTELQNGRTLGDYGIRAEATLQVTLKEAAVPTSAATPDATRALSGTLMHATNQSWIRGMDILGAGSTQVGMSQFDFSPASVRVLKETSLQAEIDRVRGNSAEGSYDASIRNIVVGFTVDQDNTWHRGLLLLYGKGRLTGNNGSVQHLGQAGAASYAQYRLAPDWSVSSILGLVRTHYKDSSASGSATIRDTSCGWRIDAVIVLDHRIDDRLDWRTSLGGGYESIAASSLYPDKRTVRQMEWRNALKISPLGPSALVRPYVELGASALTNPDLMSQGAEGNLLGHVVLGVDGAFRAGSNSQYHIRATYSGGLSGYHSFSLSGRLSITF